MENNNLQSRPHIAVLPTPGMGHLIPLAELAKRLVHHHNFSLTFITFSSSSSKAQNSILNSLPKTITSLSLPTPPLTDDLPPDARIETLISVATARSLPALRHVLLSLQKTTRLVAFVADLFGAFTFDVARDLGIPPYLFFPSNSLMLSLMLHLPVLDATFSCEFRDLPEPVKLPGCIPIPGEDILQPLQDRKNECYNWMVRHGRKYREAEGILMNTFDALEPEATKVLKEAKPGMPPVYTVGPLIQTGSADEVDGFECLKWLDEQPRGSVLFVSFGSGGTLSTKQTRELALGLEMSGQRFLWVVRSPSDVESSANYFIAESNTDPVGFLPEGFVDRTKAVGFLVRSWAPQIQVLSHGSTGGFLTHCGWNSTLESVVNGVPMIAWPLYAEQRMNAVMLVEGVKVALRAKAGEDGEVEKEDISRVVKELMEGKEGKVVRNKVRELQEAGAKALGEEGSSFKSLTEIANKWKKGLDSV